MNTHALLCEELTRELNAFKGKVSALLVDMDTEQTVFAYKPELEMVSASTIKVLIMLTALQRVMDEKLDLDDELTVRTADILSDSTVYEYGETTDTLDHLIRWMIIESDNTATNVLIRTLGMDEINTYGKQLGLQVSRVERIMLDFDAIAAGRNNYTSAMDQYKMYNHLLESDILTPELCEYAIEVLLTQRSTDNFLRYIPEPLSVAHKTGGLDCLNHDAGVFFLENVCYYLGVFASDADNDITCKRLLGRIGKLVYEDFSQEVEEE